jgi:beta-N-acetylhexosaminidase
MINIDNVKKQIGQLFILGFPGEEPSDEFLDFINQNMIGGVILFKDNCPSHSKTQSNINLINEAITDPIIAVDQEGGRVTRVIGGDVEIAGASDYANKLGLEKFKEDYKKSVGTLKSLGFNVNLAPVSDIFLNVENECLKGRCFGSTANEVSSFVVEAVTIAKENNIGCCLKHFPGLGASGVDPHHSVAIAEYDFETWNIREKIPFEAGISAGVNMIMTTHLKLLSFDNNIVTGSEKIINSLLRDKLKFDKILITDDLLMEGASSLGSIEERTVSAFNAGHDIMLFGQDFNSSKAAFNNFCRAVEQKTVKLERLKESLKRITELRKRIN